MKTIGIYPNGIDNTVVQSGWGRNLKVYGDVIYQLVCDLADKHINSLNRYEGSVKSLNARYGLWIECISSAIEDSVYEIKKEKNNEQKRV